MGTKLTTSGEIIDIGALEINQEQVKTNGLVKTEMLQLLHLVIPAGQSIPVHQVPGDITVHCLAGRIAFTAEGSTCELAAGQLLSLKRDIPHSLHGLESASVLVTRALSPAARGGQ